MNIKLTWVRGATINMIPGEGWIYTEVESLCDLHFDANDLLYWYKDLNFTTIGFKTGKEFLVIESCEYISNLVELHKTQRIPQPTPYMSMGL